MVLSSLGSVKTKLYRETQSKVRKVEEAFCLNVRVVKRTITSDSGFDQRGPPARYLAVKHYSL
jgi:hypothetical protein